MKVFIGFENILLHCGDGVFQFADNKIVLKKVLESAANVRG